MYKFKDYLLKEAEYGNVVTGTSGSEILEADETEMFNASFVEEIPLIAITGEIPYKSEGTVKQMRLSSVLMKATDSKGGVYYPSVGLNTSLKVLLAGKTDRTTQYGVLAVGHVAKSEAKTKYNRYEFRFAPYHVKSEPVVKTPKTK